MKQDVIQLDGSTAGSIDLADAVFGLEPRADLLQRVVQWQLARRQAGTHKTKGRSEIAKTGKKMFRQKGTGRARAGDGKVAQFRGGGRAHGPVVRSHAHDLPKKVRALGLKHALSAKAKNNQLVVLESAAMDAPKTRELKDRLAARGWSSVLVVDGAEVDANFKLAARNIPHTDVLPVAGINVYDILRRDTLVITRAGLAALEARFS